MSKTIIRTIYYLILIPAGIFFATNLLFFLLRHAALDPGPIKSTMVLTLFTGAYIIGSDKEYLAKSIPLRVAVVLTSLSGIVAFIVSR